MKKNISLLITLALSVGLVGGNCINVSAIEKSDSNIGTINNLGASVITLDKVINSAIENSDDLQLKEKEIKYYRDKIKLQDHTNEEYEDLGVDSIKETLLELSYDKLKVQKDQSEESKEFLKDIITKDVTDRYNTIVSNQIEIDNLKESLRIKENEMYYLKTKVEIGKAKNNDLEDKKIEIKTLKDNITSKQNLLNINKEYLGILANMNLSNCLFDSTINYNKFKIEGSIDEYIDEKIEKYVHYNEEILELTEDAFEDVKDDDIDDILDEDIPKLADYMKNTTDDEGGIDYGKVAMATIKYKNAVEDYTSKIDTYGSYLDGKYSVDEGKVKINQSKRLLKNGLKQAYASLLDLENTIDNLSDTVNSTNKKLEFAKASVENGLMTENNYNVKVLAARDLEMNLRKLINAHDDLKNNIEKPWTLSSN